MKKKILKINFPTFCAKNKIITNKKKRKKLRNRSRNLFNKKKNKENAN